ncbi:MAG: hypothetical protein ACP5G6_06200 [Conexivisphaera sp.]
MKLKVCGHVRPEDAVASRAMGVDMIGVVGVRDSPRYVPPHELRRFREAVGEFFYVVDYDSVDSIIEVGRASGAVQVHRLMSDGEMRRLGESGLRVLALVPASAEGSEYIERVRRHGLTPLVHSVGPELDPEDLRYFDDLSDSGIAGGIGIGNAHRFLGVGAMFIDVSRGSEEAPGVKSPWRIARLVELVRGEP